MIPRLQLGVCLLLGATASPAQRPLEEMQRRNAYLERRLAMEAAWQAAGEEQRERARALFEQRLERGVPAAFTASAKLLTHATRLLEGGGPDTAAIGFERRLADSLDLRVIPGAFEPADGEHGDPTIVRVLALYPVDWSARELDQVELALYWLGPGGEELQARTETVHRDAFRAPGFEMYGWAPATRGGTWRMVPEVRTEAGVARGVPVTVECIPDLADALAAARATEPRTAVEALLRRTLIETVRGGVRNARLPPVSELLQWDRGGATVPAPLDPGLAGTEGGVELPAPEGSAARRVVIVLAPPFEDAEWVLAGRQGEAWRAMVERLGCRLIATSLPAWNPRGPSVIELASRLEREDPELELVLVVHGVGLRRLQIGLSRADAGPFDRLAVHSILLREGPPELVVELPTLFFESLDSDRPAQRVRTESGVELVWVRRWAPPAIAEQALPASLARWLAGSGAESGAEARPPSEGMVSIPGGRHRLEAFEASGVQVPAREVELARFWLDAHEVTNAEFARFVEATAYVTEAERIGNTPTFDFGDDGAGAGRRAGAWKIVEGADWRHPEGPASSLEGRWQHPVVAVSYNDAVAYASWAGKRLPTDEEWEVAARGGLQGATYPWGDELEPGGSYLANYWQGAFPLENTALDGHRRTAPVGSFAPNGYGLYDMAGNVWEWTDGRGTDEQGRATRAARGGSFLCRERAAPGYHACQGYRVTSRQHKLLDDANSNVGFRCAADVR